MKYTLENNDKIIERKHKFLRYKFISIFVICDLRNEKTIEGQIFYNQKFKKIDMWR